jgi:hypothetical protein
MGRFLLVTLFLAGLIFAGSCRKEVFTQDPGAKLQFSTDTVQFDTIFTSVGSATHNFMVYNRNSNALRMDIRLAGGPASPFRINIDGRATTEFKDYELAGKDSMFIFAEVTIDPAGGNLPIVVMDSVMFDFNGNHQRVILVAFGQDVHMFKDSILPCNEIWTNDKPYLIYDYAAVGPNCKLTIEQGVQVYGYQGAVLFVQGQLEVNGTKDEPVVFSGNRREKKYSTTSGQWRGIILAPGSSGNKITHAIIENGDVGLEVDSLPPSTNDYNLSIEKTIIRNMSSYGLLGQSSTIQGKNLLIHACGRFTFLGDYGGNYDFVNCTFDNSFSSANRKLPSVVLTNRDIPTYPANPIKAVFLNSIIWGSMDDELGFDLSGHGTAGPFTFQNNILKIKETKVNDPSNILNQYPKFKKYQDGDYQLDTLSPAVNAGILFNPPHDVLDDLNDNPRMGNPDIGCFERE